MNNKMKRKLAKLVEYEKGSWGDWWKKRRKGLKNIQNIQEKIDEEEKWYNSLPLQKDLQIKADITDNHNNRMENLDWILTKLTRNEIYQKYKQKRNKPRNTLIAGVGLTAILIALSAAGKISINPTYPISGGSSKPSDVEQLVYENIIDAPIKTPSVEMNNLNYVIEINGHKWLNLNPLYNILHTTQEKTN